MTISNQIDRAVALLSRSRRAIALTGAGISTPSGIPDFRSPDSGLWRHKNPLEVASIYAFRHRPQDFYDWIHPFARQTIDAEPNAAHYALAQLEMQGTLRGVITQNVDMLHGKAGSAVVYEVHGHLREVTCLNCYTIYPSSLHLEKFVDSGEVPRCDSCNGVLKPNLILIGEQLPIRIFNQAKKEASSCDVMLVVGSSLEMAPAAELPLLAAESGARLIIVNNEPTPADQIADVIIRADVVEVLPRLAAPFLGN